MIVKGGGYSSSDGANVEGSEYRIVRPSRFLILSIKSELFSFFYQNVL